jgi:hypothetical protein
MDENSLQSIFQESLAVGLNFSMITQDPEGDDITTTRLISNGFPRSQHRHNVPALWDSYQIRSKTSLDVDL